jgi:hypothetical protein
MENHYKYIRQILILTLILFPKLTLIFIGLNGLPLVILRRKYGLYKMEISSSSKR